MSTSSRSTLAQVASTVNTAPGFGTLLKPFEVVGFWSAVVLPFLYVPLLVSGPGTPAERTAFRVLLLVHVVALVFGHRYQRD